MFDFETDQSNPAMFPGVVVRLNAATPQFKAGQLLVVERIDTDGTFIGRDPATGKQSNWINFRRADIVHAVGWEFLVTALTPRGRKLLEAFEGHRELSLRSTITDALVRTVPDLATAIVDTHEELESSKVSAPDASPAVVSKRPPRGRHSPPRRPPDSGPPKPPLAEPELDLPALYFGSASNLRSPAAATVGGESHE